MKQFIAVSCLIVIAGTADADVMSAGPGGFAIENAVVIDADRARVWQAAVDEIGQWWHDDHTISGDASRMSIDARPMGCFCESLPGHDGVVHLVVTSVSRNIMLRLTGGLGPLGLMGVNGNMTWEFTDSEEGTIVTLNYALGGYMDGGLDSIAEAVNGVLVEQMTSLKAFVENQGG